MTTRPEIDAACRQVDVAWGPARMNAGLARLKRRGSHSRHYWLGAIGIVAGAAAAFLVLKPKVSDDRWLNVAVQVGQELTLADGTVAAPEVVTAGAADRPSSVELVENSPIRQIVKVTDVGLTKTGFPNRLRCDSVSREGDR